MAKIIYGTGQGIFIVDDEDYDWLNQYSWGDPLMDMLSHGLTEGRFRCID